MAQLKKNNLRLRCATEKGLRRRLPKISGVFCGIDTENLDNEQEIPWTEKLKIYDSMPRINNTMIPRNIFAQFYITTEEIGIISYNFNEELYFNLKASFQSIIDWTSKRYQLVQCIMNDRLGLNLLHANSPPELTLSRKNTSKRGELSFISELNRPSFVKTHQVFDSRKWSDRVSKTLAINTSGTSITADNKTMDFTRSLQHYAGSLYLNLNHFKSSLLPFDVVYDKILNINLRYACVKIIREDSPEEKTLDVKDPDSSDIFFDDSYFKITDMIQHHIERFIEVAKTFYKQSKNKIRLKALMKPKGIPMNYKKSLLNTFITRSFTLNNQQVPLFLITNLPLDFENLDEYSIPRHNPDWLLRQNSEEEEVDNSPIALINSFFERLMSEILTDKCLKEYEKFFTETTNPNGPDSLDGSKLIFSNSELDGFDMRKAPKGSPTFGLTNTLTQHLKERDETTDHVLAATTLNDHPKEDLTKYFNENARGNIIELQQSQKLFSTTIYLRHVVQTVLFVFKLEISYPFVSLSILWDTLTDNKDKVTNIINKEALKIVSNINLQSIVYDYHINLFKDIITDRFPNTISFDLSLIFLNFTKYFHAPPTTSESVFYGSNISINPGYLYIKFNAASVWQFMASNHKKYGLRVLSTKDTNSFMYVLEDYSEAPLLHDLDRHSRPQVVFIMHNEQSKKDNIPAEAEKKLHLDESINTELLYISYFVLYDKEACGMKLEQIKNEIAKITLELIRKLRKHYIAQIFLNKIMRHPDRVLSSDELQNLLQHSNATSLKIYEKETHDHIAELEIFNHRFIKYFEGTYPGHVKFFREDHMLEMNETNKTKEVPISSILVSNKSQSLVIFIQMNSASCIEDIYLLKTNDDPKRLSIEEIVFFKGFKKNLLIYVWKYNLLTDPVKFN